MNLTQEDWVSNLEADANAVILDVRTEDECKRYNCQCHKY
jgi:rhodanese-related sulfurtransferase